MEKRIMMLKILSDKYKESFLDGQICFNTATYFKNLEAADIVRHDADEGLHESRQFKEISIQDEESGEWIPIKGIIGPLRYRNSESTNFNIFCLYTVEENSSEIIDDRNLAFGESFVLIHNPIEFIKRLKKALEPLNRACLHGPVEYVDANVHDGYMGPFRKYDAFSYQKEFRFAIDKSDGNRLIIELDNLRDICSVGKTSELNILFGRSKMEKV